MLSRTKQKKWPCKIYLKPCALQLVALSLWGPLEMAGHWDLGWGYMPWNPREDPRKGGQGCCWEMLLRRVWNARFMSWPFSTSRVRLPTGDSRFWNRHRPWGCSRRPEASLLLRTIHYEIAFFFPLKRVLFKCPAYIVKRGSFKNFFIPCSFFQILYRRVNFQIHPEGGVSISVSPLNSKVPQR